MADKTLISTRDASGVVGLAEQPLDLLCATGRIPGATYRGGRWWIPRTFVQERAELNPRGLCFAPFGVSVDARP